MSLANPNSTMSPAGLSLSRRLWNAALRLFCQGKLPPFIVRAWNQLWIAVDIWFYDLTRLVSKRGATSQIQKGPPLIHFFLPTYAGHFSYLLLSLKSLLALNFPYLGKIYVYQNPGAPFSQKQIEQLRLLVGDRLVIGFLSQRYRISLSRVWWNLAAWREIEPQIGPEDWLVKCDSDILWIRPSVLEQVQKSDWELVGHACDAYLHYSGFVFCQGGLYFLRASLLPRLRAQRLWSLLKVKLPALIEHYDPIRFCPEEAAAYLAVVGVGARIHLSKLYLESLDGVSTAGELESVVHYEGTLTKDDMIRDAAKLGL